MTELEFDELCDECLTLAYKSKEENRRNTEDMDLFELADLYIILMLEKLEKDYLSDMSIDYNDEIISIEEVGDKETIDITVTGDNLFYCNNILTKNSVGLPFTLDAFFGLVTNEELEEMGQLMIKQLKNRWGDLNYYRRFIVGIDRSKMRLFNTEEGAQQKNLPGVKTELIEDQRSKKKLFDAEGIR